ncbi:NAD(P)H-dependent oxidoreductase [Streptomyces asiaticus]|uniref:NAD(P)H-dependent oxidoreductase n=1 Tax=Streptomyces asiaticus TaxID=114695 RepID=UPI003D723BE0
MSDLKLAIILGSTRPGRNGEAVANWVLAKAKERANADYELIDLRQQLSFSLLTDFENFSVFKPSAIHDSAASVLPGQLESWAGALKPVRS